MKHLAIASLLCITLLFTTCKKQDYCPGPPKKDSTCDLVQSFLFIDALPNEGGGLFSLYRKEYDQNGRVKKVVAGLYTLRLYDSVALLLKYQGSTIYILDEKHPSDTFIAANFDAQHRLQKMIKGNASAAEGYNPFSSTEFYYKNNRLSSYLILYVADTSRLDYDANGNIIRIHRDSDQEDAGFFYTYDLSATAERQFYPDSFINDSENAIYLAQFLGWLPDLEPKNIRTSWKLVFNADDPTDDVPPYVFDSAQESGHVFDANGNLVSYDNGAYTNVWTCSSTKN